MSWGLPHRARLAGDRWHFQHGPIDLVIGVDGSSSACSASLDACWQRFDAVLVELVAELPALRSNAMPRDRFIGPIARRMAAACEPYWRDFGLFITPMAAVAGSVADELIGCFERQQIERAYINNGGDIALYLGVDASYDVGLIANIDRPAAGGAFRVTAESGIRGIATSGWRGRSFSLGIADSVTVLARTAAAADAAATMIANHVNVDHPAIVRRPADSLKDDTDLGNLDVTVAVGALPAPEQDVALDRGARFAEQARALALIDQAALSLAGRWRIVEPVAVESGRLVA